MGVNFVNIPQELKQNASFCVWKRELRQGKMAKVPYNPKTGNKAQTNTPSTFSDFATAMKAYALGGTEGHPDWDGIGFRVSEGIGAIDIDHCIREDGSLNDVAASVLGFFKDAYFERSPSGTGLRGFFMLSPDFAYDRTVYYINNRKLGMEVYLPGTTNRFVTVTGDVYRAGSVPLDMEALRSVLDTFMKRKARVSNNTVEPCSYLSDEQVVERASRSASGEKFRALYGGKWEGFYGSQSDADMAFVSMLAFWCGNDSEQIDRIFRSSGLMRDKWDRSAGDATYGQITVRNAVATNSTIYLPVRDGTAPEEDFADLGDPDDLDDPDDMDDPDYLDEDALEDDGIDEPDGTGTRRRKKKGRKGDKPDFEPDTSHVKLTLEEMQPHTNPRYQRDEIGIGNAFADYYKPIARFDRDRGIWYVYDGKAWRPDEGGLAVMELAKKLANSLYMFALQIKDEDVRNRYIKRVQKLQLRKNRRTMIEDAKSVHPVAHRVFDRSIYLFNCRNGTLDLETGEFRGHDPADFLTMISGIDYDPGASCPRWEQFVQEVMLGNADIALYLQKALGYALTGDTSLECLFILFGATSRNGKGTTMETFLKIVGDYGKTSNPEMLSAKFGNTSSSGPSEEIARLAGARFVNISEPEKRISFNAALVKRMTGNDTLNARFLHENSFDFRPNFKIFINTNYRPTVTDMTLFDSKRLKIIPFKRHFPEEEQDTDLKKFFARPDNLSGIFNWCYEGYRRFREEKLAEPQAVTDAIRDYQEESDRIGQFVEAWMEEGETYEVRTSAAYTLYTTWCEDNNYRPESRANFKTSMQRFFPVQKKRPADGSGSATPMFIGCRFLKQERGTDPESDAQLKAALLAEKGEFPFLE